MPKFTCMNKECDNHAFGCSGNCKFETVAFNKNGDCLQFEPKPKGVEKIPPHTMSSANYIEKKINEIIDAVNELRRELEGK